MFRQAVEQVWGKSLTDQRFSSLMGESIASAERQEGIAMRSIREITEQRYADNALREQVESLHAELARSREAQESAQEQLRQLRKFERSTSELFWIMDLKGKFTYISPSSEHLWGYRPEELMGLSLVDVMTPVSLAIVAEASRRSTAAIQAGLHPENLLMELEQFGKDGIRIWSEVVVEYVFDDDGVFLERRGITRDITRRKCNELLLEDARMVADSAREVMEAEVAERIKAEELLLIHQRKLEVLNQDLEVRVADEVKRNRLKDQSLMHIDKMASVGQLAAGVAHEINNPICFVTSNLGILADYLRQMVLYDKLVQESCHGESGQDSRELINRGRAVLKVKDILTDGSDLIEESLEGVQRVAKIVRDLKSFSRVDAAEEEWATLDSCVENALNVCFDELNSVASIRKAYEPMPSILCHYGQLNQVFMNLLVNAAQAITPRGEIFIRSWQDDSSVSVSISDTGKGMPEEVMDRIFEPFFTTKDVGKGTGLGLSVSHEIIRRHGGEILVSSTVGVGTTFTVTLPKNMEVVS